MCTFTHTHTCMHALMNTYTWKSFSHYTYAQSLSAAVPCHPQDNIESDTCHPHPISEMLPLNGPSSILLRTLSSICDL